MPTWGILKVVFLLFPVLSSYGCSWNVREAAHWGRNEKVLEFLEVGVDVNEKGYWGNTALTVAMGRRHLDTARLLINRGADVNVRDDTAGAQGGIPPLVWATDYRDTELVRLMLEKGADPNLCSKRAQCALQRAAYHGDAESVRLLLARGADPNACDTEGFSALINAAYFGHVEIVRMLLDRGADPLLVSAKGFTALENARARGHRSTSELLSTRIAQMQGRAVAVANAAVATRPTSPLLAAATSNDAVEVVRLTSEGADLREQDSKGWTALHHAAKAGAEDAAAALINSGAGVNAADKAGLSPLNLASLSEDTAPALVGLLLRAGANANEVNEAPYVSAKTQWHVSQHSAREREVARALQHALRAQTLLTLALGDEERRANSLRNILSSTGRAGGNENMISFIEGFEQGLMRARPLTPQIGAYLGVMKANKASARRASASPAPAPAASELDYAQRKIGELHLELERAKKFAACLGDGKDPSRGPGCVELIQRLPAGGS